MDAKKKATHGSEMGPWTEGNLLALCSSLVLLLDDSALDDVATLIERERVTRARRKVRAGHGAFSVGDRITWTATDGTHASGIVLGIGDSAAYVRADDGTESYVSRDSVVPTRRGSGMIRSTARSGKASR